MPHTVKFHNFEITTYDPLSLARENILVNAVLSGQGLVDEAKRKTLEALAVLAQNHDDFTLLPSDFALHVKTLLRCSTDVQGRKAMMDAARALNILSKGLGSTELKFIEWGMDKVSNAVDAISGALKSVFSSIPKLYQPTDLALTRGITMTGGSYIGASSFQKCLNTGAESGNPNAIMIKLEGIDKGLAEFTDTVVHEATHKFLGTIDEGMNTSGLSWMKDDGLVNMKQQYPGVPLPIETPQFRAMGPTEALGNAYILTGYILYMPKSDPGAWYALNQQAKTGPLGSQTELGGVLRRALASRQPPG